MIGSPLTRREDARMLRGEATYVDDITRPGLAHVAFVRSPQPHAAITADPQAAGPRRLTAAELRVRPFPVGAPDGAQVAAAPHPVLAQDEVRYVGQPVALVVAVTRALAEDAAELVEVDYAERAGGRIRGSRWCGGPARAATSTGRSRAPRMS